MKQPLKMDQQFVKKTNWLLTKKILFVCAQLLFLFFLYKVLLTGFVDWKNDASKHVYYSATALSFKNPNIEGIETIEIENMNLLGTNEIKYTLNKRIGDSTEENVIIEMTIPIISSLSTLEVDRKVRQEYGEDEFYLPNDPWTGEKITALVDESDWKQLEMLHEGTVATMNFSVNEYMTPERLLQTLQGIDLAVLWMPLYTGEFNGFEPSFTHHYENMLSITDRIGIAPSRTRTHSSNFTSEVTTQSAGLEITLDTIDEDKENMLKNMSEMINEPLKLINIDHLPNRYEFLKEEGFSVYGATVTGPVKELLKLKEIPQVHNAKVTDVSYWNWTSRLTE